MKGRYKRFKAWCWECDHYLVTGGAKCPRCGAKMYANRKYIRANNIKESSNERTG